MVMYEEDGVQSLSRVHLSYNCSCIPLNLQ